MASAFLTILFTHPLCVSLVLLGAICVAIAIIGKIPPAVNIEGARAAILAGFGILLIIVAIVVAWVLTPSVPKTSTSEESITNPAKHRINEFGWCQTQNQTVRVNGRLIDENGMGVSGETLQIKIFPDGGPAGSELEPAIFVTTGIDGRVSAEIRQTRSWSIANDRYVINFVYWYNDSSGKEQFRKIDFKQGKPDECPQDSTSLSETLATQPINRTERNVSAFQKGLTFVGWQKGEYSSPAAEQSLTALASTGANWVAIVVTVYQTTVSDPQIAPSDKTPTDDDLIYIISKAHALGLQVILKPHIDIESSGQWRGEIAFSTEEDWNAWFDSYRQNINHYAEIAQQTQTEAFSVGTELVGTSERAADWKRVVDDVRSRFPGKLTYASNFDEVVHVQWWTAVDYIGVDAYFPLPTPSDNPTTSDLEAAWLNQGYLTTLEQLSDQYGRQILLTEIGYRPIKGANEAPWQWQNSAEIDLTLQANLYEAALKTFSDKEWVAGIFFWNWLTFPNQGGLNDLDYTPKGKPAEDVLRSFYNQ